MLLIPDLALGRCLSHNAASTLYKAGFDIESHEEVQMFFQVVPNDVRLVAVAGLP